MNRKPAFAEEVDPATGEPIPGGPESSAAFSLTAEQAREQRKTWRRSLSDYALDSSSSNLGHLRDVLVAQCKKNENGEEKEFLTIVAGEHEDIPTIEAWKECEDLGGKFRLFRFKDEVINGENSTCIMREILLSKDHDLNCEDPDLVVVQRNYGPNSAISLIAHKLLFKGRLDVDRPYIFPKLGDEIPGVGCPDIHFTFRGIRDWTTVAKKAKFAGFDRNVRIDVTRGDVENGRKVVFDLEKGEVVGLDVKPTLGVMISCADFKGILAPGFCGSKEDGSEEYPSPPSKKRRMSEAEPEKGEASKTIELKLIGMGPEVDNGASRADLNINLVIKS